MSTGEKSLAEICLSLAKSDGLFETGVVQIRVVRRSEPSLPLLGVYRPSLFFIVQGAKEISVGPRNYLYDEDQYLMTSVQLPVVGRIKRASSQKPYLCVVMSFEPKLIHKVIREAGLEDSIVNQEGIQIGEVDHAIKDAIRRLCISISAKQDRDYRANLVMQEIVLLLLRSKFGSVVRQIGLTGSSTQRVAKAVEHIKKHFTNDDSVSELAKIAGMSSSSFHDHFKRVTTMSPLQYRKHLRLHEAHRLLHHDVMNATEVSFRVGYESPSQFTREYKRLFGFTPKAQSQKAL